MFQKRLNDISNLLIERKGIYSLLVQLGASFALTGFMFVALFAGFFLGAEANDVGLFYVLTALVVLIITVVVSLMIQVGYTNSLKEISRGNNFSIKHFKEGQKYFFPYFGYSLLLILGISFILGIAFLIFLLPATLLMDTDSILYLLYENSITSLFSGLITIYLSIFLVGIFFEKGMTGAVLRQNKKEIFLVSLGTGILLAIPIIGMILSLLTLLVIPYVIVLFAEISNKENTEFQVKEGTDSLEKGISIKKEDLEEK